MKPLLTLAAVGVAGVFAWQVLLPLFVPVLAVLVGVMVTVLKLGVVALLIYLAYRLIRRLDQRPDETG